MWHHLCDLITLVHCGFNVTVVLLSQLLESFCSLRGLCLVSGCYCGCFIWCIPFSVVSILLGELAKARQGLYNRNVGKLAFRLMLNNFVRLETHEK